MKLLTILYFLAMVPTDAQKGTLTIEIKGIKEAKGTIQLALYNKKDGFATKKNVYLGKKVKVNSTTVKVKITDLPYGDYAIAAYHDANGNDKIDKNFFGVPTELYGFSNNARGSLGPPDFDDAKFSVNAAQNNTSFTVK